MTARRRELLRDAAVVAATAAIAKSAVGQGPQIKIGKGLRDLSDETLDFFRMLGVRHVVMPSAYSLTQRRRGLVPATDTGPRSEEPLQPWDPEVLKRIKTRIEGKGLVPMMIHLGRVHRVVQGRPDAAAEIEAVKTNIRIAGALRIPVIEYNFIALRGSEGYGRTIGTGGIGLRDYDESRTRDLPPLDNVGTHTREELWERLDGFLRAVIPVAEDSGVRLAMHPNDPPIPVFRGVAQPMRSLADQKELIDLYDSPSNGITLDTGVTTEMGEDAAEAIRYFGSRDRINHVHFRNVRVEVPYYKYLEVPHDAGNCDMLACMKAFKEVGYRYLVIPDHTPEFADDTLGSQMGWAFAIGYLRALQHAAES